MGQSAQILPAGGIPVFPLPNCVLLPGAVLRLHLFEPRYCKMMRDLLKREQRQRVIAVALLKDGYEALYHTNHAAIHAVVCAGQVIHHEELPDGRFNLLLLGFCRATIGVEDKSSDYRVAHLRPIKTADDMLDEEGALAELRDLLRLCVELEVCLGEAVDKILEAAPALEALVDLLAFHFIPGEEYELKQRVLDERSLAVRAEIVARRIRSLLEHRRRSATRAPDEDEWPPRPSLN